MATSGRRAQEAIRAHGSSKCSKHYGKELIYVCENCDVLACVDCAIQQHKGHELESLSNVVPKAKQKLQDFIKRAEITNIPRIKEKFKLVDANLLKNKKTFYKQVSLIKERNDTLKKELDRIAHTMEKTCHDIEHLNSDKLLNHQKELQTQLDKLSSKIQEVKATLKSGSDVLVYDTLHLIPSEFNDLPTPSCSTAEFSPGKLALQQLEHLLGKLNITDHYQPSVTLSQPANWRVMSEFTPYKGNDIVTSMHAAGDKAWLSNCLHTMFSVNQKGQVQQTLEYMDIWFRDFCISPQTGNIWFCSDDNGVGEVKDSRHKVRFTTDTEPLSICVTTDDHVLVGTDRQIGKYTQIGQTICTTSRGIPPVVRSPWRMSECPLTRHIAVVDLDKIHYGGGYKPCISILNDKLQLLHTYRGQVQVSGQHLPPSPFSPQDVCYTDTGELVITDNNNKSVELVTGRGEFLQTLYTDSESEPKAISVLSGALWVSLQNGNVKVLTDI